jgi:hypothetical protein
MWCCSGCAVKVSLLLNRVVVVGSLVVVVKSWLSIVVELKSLLFRSPSQDSIVNVVNTIII